MIRKLKLKFLLLSMTALTVLITLILVGMNGINYHAVVKEADQTLVFLSQHKGTFPEFGGKPDGMLPPHMSPETPYETRFFSVVLDSEGAVVSTDTRRISAVDDALAADHAVSAIKKSRNSGFIGDFRYLIRSEPIGTRITFLDCGRTLAAASGFLWASIFMAVVGLIVVCFVLFVLSGRIIRPIAESHAKQKQFITDAGHEIKTPLTIIAANVDILEMELGEGNESLSDIRSQTHRLRRLTDDLVLLTRMEEAQSTLQKVDFPISEVVAEAAHSFSALATMQDKTLTCRIHPLLSLCGNDKAIVQLVSILLDNAIKYSPPGGEITLTLAGAGHALRLNVANTAAQTLSAEQLAHIFDRFYRADNSRNSETGGHGIGLSVAQAIVSAHGGRIAASMPTPDTFLITVTLPI